MSKYKKSAAEETKNNWITPTVIAAIIGLIGTLLSLYFGYLTTTRPLELAATQTADARIFTLTLIGLTPTTQNLPTVTATFIPATAVSTLTTVTSVVQATSEAISTKTLTPTLTPTGLKFCINSRSINVRAGPGTDFGAIGFLTFEDCLYFDGYSQDSQDSIWLHISPNQDKYPNLKDGWLRSDLVRPQDFTQLPVIYLPTATPTPEG